MKMIKYIFLFTIIGFIVGVVISIGIVGFKCSDVDSRDCKGGCSFFFDCLNPLNCFYSCLEGVGEGCYEGCERGCNTGDNCSERVGGCIGGCIDGWSSCDTCIDFELGCRDCTKYCNLCTETRKDDIKHAYNDINRNSKAKNYVIYLTIIGAIIGIVFGAVSTVQANKNQAQKIENYRQIVEQDADNNRKKLKQISEDKWNELQNWLKK